LGVCLWRVFFDSNQHREPTIHGLLPLISDQAQMQSWMIPYFVPGLENTSSVTWSPDGRLLIVGYKDVPTLVVWDVAEHRYTMLRQGPRCGTTQLEIHPDGTYLLQSLGYIFAD
jgi:WD40 repeat protein